LTGSRIKLYDILGCDVSDVFENRFVNKEETMQIKILREGERLALPESDKDREFFLYQFYWSYNHELQRWEKQYLTQWEEIVDFVGIVCLNDMIYLSIPKTAEYDEKEEKQDVLVRYGQLLEMYFAYVEKCAEAAGVRQRKYFPRKDLAAWCRCSVATGWINPDRKIIAAVKFEKVFEWMIAGYFDNQLHLQDKKVLFDSRLEQRTLDINESPYQVYEWQPINVPGESRPGSRQITLTCDEPRRNIPATVIDGELDGQKYCVVMDAKYWGWDAGKNRYHLPENSELYQQFFCQEQFGRICRCSGNEGAKVYSIFFLPDYSGDVKKLMYPCARIVFRTDDDHMISVWKIHMDNLIDEILTGKYSVSREEFMEWLADVVSDIFE
jgi:hypothetical protein